MNDVFALQMSNFEYLINIISLIQLISMVVASICINLQEKKKKVYHKCALSLWRRKEMFYLMMHSTHLSLYGFGHMAKAQSDSRRANLLLPLHGLHFSFSSKGYFIDRIAHTMAFVTPIIEDWLK